MAIPWWLPVPMMRVICSEVTTLGLVRLRKEVASFFAANASVIKT